MEAHYWVNEHGDNDHQMYYSVDLSILHIFLMWLWHCFLEKDHVEGTISITLYVYDSIECKVCAQSYLQSSDKNHKN